MQLLFNDYETFNLNPCGGAATQFASMLTNEDFDGTISRNFFCKVSGDTLPQVEAALVTKHTPQTIAEEEASFGEYEFIQKILEVMQESPSTCVIGYNSKSFDDEWTRNLAYRNFFPPYEWHFKNGNSRYDALNLIVATHALRPELLKWKIVDAHDKDGNVIGTRPSMKLEDLAEVNGISHISAHDALSDVSALKDLMSIIKKKDPDFYDAALKVRDKSYVLDLLNNKESSNGVVYVSRFEKDTQFAGYVIPICQSISDKNVYWCWDSKVNPSKILSLPEHAQSSLMSLKKEQMEELGLERKGLVKVKINGLPNLLPKGLMRKEDAARTGLTDMRDTLICNIAQAKALRADLVALTREVELNSSFSLPVDDFDHKIYSGGFFSPSENAFCKQFHAAKTWSERAQLLRDSSPTARITDMGMRIIGRNAPEVFSKEEKAVWDGYVSERFSGKHINSIELDDGSKLSRDSYLEHLNLLIKDMTAEGKDSDLSVISDLIEYYKN